MIAPGQKFTYSDIAAFIAQANSVSSSDLDLSGLYDVSPMYNDLNGNKYGYRQLVGIAISARGINYQVGDQLQAPLTGSNTGANLTFEVAAVDNMGGVTGLLTLTNPGFAPGIDSSSWPTGNDPTSPASLSYVTTGSGSGAQISFSVAQIGPEAQFSMPDHNPPGIVNVNIAGLPGQGSFTDFYVIDGGIGYKLGDSLTLPSAYIQVSGAQTGPVPVNVTGVDANGAITSFSLPNTSFNLIYFSLPEQPLAASGGSGSGATFGGLFVILPRQEWLTELNRLRSNLSNVIGNGQFPPGQLYCSQSSPGVGWPKSPYTSSMSYYDINSSYQEFYFADTGQNETITASYTGASGYAPIYGEPWYYDSFDVQPLPTANGFWPTGLTWISGVTYQFTIKCPPGTTFSGTLYQQAVAGSRWDGQVPQNGTQTTSQPSFALGGSGGNGISWNPPGPGGPPGYGPYTALVALSGLGDGTYTVSLSGGWLTQTPLDANGNPIAWGSGVVEGIRTDFNVIVPSYIGDPASSGWPGSPWFSGSYVPIIGGNNPAGSAVIQGQFTPSIVCNAVETNGIHNSKKIFKIELPALDLNPVGYGVFLVGKYPVDDPGNTSGSIYWNSPATPGDPLVWAGIKGWSSEHWLGGASASLTLTPSTSGFWVGSTPPISSLNLVSESQMPWNLTRTKAGSTLSSATAQVNPMLLGDLAPPNSSGNAQQSNSYNQSLPVEKQMEPPSWLANTYFTKGFRILDSNGNWQTVQSAGTSGSAQPTWGTPGQLTTDGSNLSWLCSPGPRPQDGWKPGAETAAGTKICDKNGNAQVAQNSGTTGPMEPNWKTFVNGITPDNGINWEMTGPYLFLIPAIHRIPDLPSYPCYWQRETIPRLKLPTSTSGLTALGAYDQWYPVNFYQPGVADPGWHQQGSTDTQGMAFGWWIYSVSLNRIQPGEVSVTIGCMRNGSFVAFGTYLTGQTVQVLWPVFTSDALVYQCSERVNIQALAISGGASGVSVGWMCASPGMIAAYFNDIEYIINHLP